jgi:N12 class adenine-specific DNA methylase
MEGISELRHNRGDSFSVKQLEKDEKTVKQKIEKLNDQSRKDDLVTFEELGIDRVFIDEAHLLQKSRRLFQNAQCGRHQSNGGNEKQRPYMKCRYLDE